MRRAFFLSMLLVGCAGGSPAVSPDMLPVEPPYELPTPEVVTVAPGAVQVGDTVQFIGKNFVPTEHGDVRAKFNGFYTSSTGTRTPYAGEISLKYVNPGVATFE